MWVYPSDEVRTSPETTALLPQLPAESGTSKQPVPEPLNAGEAMPGAAHAAKVYMRKSGKKCVVVFVGGGPPACIFVIYVFIGTHYIEWGNRHKAVRTDCTRIRRSEVRCSDEGIYISNRLVCR